MRNMTATSRPRLVDWLYDACKELFVFGLKQANAALFGGLLLAFMLLTTIFEFPYLYRYDAIFLYAIAIQIILLVGRLETFREMAVIFGFHLVATVMEIYKTSEMIGSWDYPEPALIAVWNVPLFAGFMHSAVGSYIARAWKVLDLRFANYPPGSHLCVGRPDICKLLHPPLCLRHPIHPGGICDDHFLEYTGAVHRR